MTLESKKKIFVLDTNVLLSDSKAIHSFGENEIILPITVLEELDRFKNFDNGLGFNARRSVKEILNALHTGYNPRKGAILKNGCVLRIKTDYESSKIPKTLDKKKNDNKIIDFILSIKSANKGRDVVLVTGDANMTAIAMSLNIKVQSYTPSSYSYNSDYSVYKGIRNIFVEDGLIDAVQSDAQVVLPEQDDYIVRNEFLILKSEIDPKKSAMVRYLDKDRPLRKIYTSKNVSFSGLSPRNKEQRLYLDLLTDPSIECVTSTGTAGSGKTILALAAGLEQVASDSKSYSRLIVTRPIQPFGKDIGFLPGDKAEKLSEWLSPIWDNLHEIVAGNRKMRNFAGVRRAKDMIQDYIEQGVIEVEALTYIKGRSINNAYIIVDEAEDLTEDNFKRILTRVGYNSKIVLTGDVSQIDNPNINPHDSGFMSVIKKMIDRPNVAHITLTKGERSSIANIASEVL